VTNPLALRFALIVSFALSCSPCTRASGPFNPTSSPFISEIENLNQGPGYYALTVAGDFNGDGKTDIVVGSLYGTTVFFV
jgi:hypothetical protein